MSIKKILLEEICKVSKEFLEDEILVTVTKYSISKECKKLNNISIISYEADDDFLLILSISDNLLEKIYNILVPIECEGEEKIQMLQELSSEVINIVAGLAIGEFPKPYDNITLTPPLMIDKERIKRLQSRYEFTSANIETSAGDFCFILIKM